MLPRTHDIMHLKSPLLKSTANLRCLYLYRKNMLHTRDILNVELLKNYIFFTKQFYIAIHSFNNPFSNSHIHSTILHVK